MKLWVFSDLHLEFDDWTTKGLPDADVCVVAGDVMPGAGNAVRYLGRTIGRHMPVVFVAGNHEFYGHPVFEGLEWARNQADELENAHFLENDCLVLGGVRFLGCTLWTDYEVEGDDDQDLAMATALTQLNDHRLIMRRALPEREPWLPAHALQEHRRSRKWLEAELTKPFDGPTVVVTHHAPHPLSIHPRFQGSMLNGAFISDLGEVMESFGPELWVHGHVHDSHDYRVGRTRVVCNPRGYGSENPAFDPTLVVEV